MKMKHVPETAWLGARFDPAKRIGHYESYFLRANHPERALAFWIRYTVFSPRGGSDGDLGEIWAIWFDGEKGRVVAAKNELDISRCSLNPEKLDVRIGEALLQPGALQGTAQSGENRLQWQLSYSGGGEPVPLLPLQYYQRSLPKAKAVVTRPNVHFNGEFTVNGEHLRVDDWQGSENHNWGSKHTDEYAWGQVAGFDGHPDTFLEAITARIRLGPLWSPWLTLACLHHAGRDYAFNQLSQAFSARSDIRFGNDKDFRWSFLTRSEGGRLSVVVSAPRGQFVGLNYYNPPGGSHTCLNSKIARCELQLETAEGSLQLVTRNRAAFEILTDRQDHGVPVVA